MYASAILKSESKKYSLPAPIQIRVIREEPGTFEGAQGLEVELAPDSLREGDSMNFIFNHNMRFGVPLIALKLAQTASRMVTERSGYPSEITGANETDVMRWRPDFSRHLYGFGTVLADDPSLTARLPDETWCRCASQRILLFRL